MGSPELEFPKVDAPISIPLGSKVDVASISNHVEYPVANVNGVVSIVSRLIVPSAVVVSAKINASVAVDIDHELVAVVVSRVSTWKPFGAIVVAVVVTTVTTSIAAISPSNLEDGSAAPVNPNAVLIVSPRSAVGA